MAVERVLSERALAEIKAAVALPGSAAYLGFSSIASELYDKAADLGVMQAAGVDEKDIASEKKALFEGLDASGRTLMTRIIDTAQSKALDAMAEGHTLATTAGLVVWNSETSFPTSVAEEIRKTGFKGDMRAMEHYFSYARVEAALRSGEQGKTISGGKLDGMVEEIFEAHLTKAEKTGMKVRGAAKTLGGFAGSTIGLPLALIGGIGGALIGATRQAFTSLDGTRRDALRAHKRINAGAGSHGEVVEGVAMIKSYKHNYIGKGFLWGAGLTGGLGALLGGSLGNGLASIGGSGSLKEQAAAKIAIRAGLKAGLEARGMKIIEDAKEKDGQEAAEKEGKAERVLGRAGSPFSENGEYYYDADEAKKKAILSEIAGALGVDKMTLINQYFGSPSASSYVDIAQESLSVLGGRNAVIAPDFANTPAELAQQKSEMLAYQESLAQQGIASEVMQIKVAGSSEMQWAVVGSGLTAAQVSFAAEASPVQRPAAQVSVLPHQVSAPAAAVAAPVAQQPQQTFMPYPMQYAPMPMPMPGYAPYAPSQQEHAVYGELKTEIAALRDAQNTMAADLHAMAVGSANPSLSSKEIAAGVTAPNPAAQRDTAAEQQAVPANNRTV